ncbi:hypothetical protein LZ31DRAFT_189833 [Colletotrichum somersetense]|nr:hypothetical protein LZ31DRAFT_189833 [Colletotrichum somersetense]
MHCLLSLAGIQPPMQAGSHEIDGCVKNYSMCHILTEALTLPVIPFPEIIPRRTWLVSCVIALVEEPLCKQ